MSLSPIFRWVGGKRQLLRQLDSFLPDDYNIYYEPFFGGGALFLHLEPRKSIINDTNRALMNAYRQISQDPARVLPVVVKMLESFSSDQYYEARQRYNDLRGAILGKFPTDSDDAVELASLFTYLNRTNFNGLWRENKSGEYNAPIGKFAKSPTVNVDNAIDVSRSLNGTIMMSGDFEETTREASAGDLVYFDPPYDKENNGSFDAFVAGGFSSGEQHRLSLVAHDLADKGVYVILSNSDTPLIRSLYDDMFIHVVHERRSINSDTEKRAGVGTLIVTNFLN